MKSLNDLNHILLKFSEEEKKVLIKHVQLQSPISTKENKSLKLLHFLITENISNSITIQNLLYGQIKYTAFNKLVIRLKNKALDVLLFDSNLNNGTYSKRNRIIFYLRKKLIQADLLQLKGMRNEILPMYNFIIKKSKEFELYDILIQSLYSFQRLVSVHGNKKLIAKSKSETQYYEKCWILLNQSQTIYNETMNKISVSSNSSSYEEDLNYSIEKLSINYNQTKSSIINYYILHFKVEVSQNNANFTKAEKYLENSLQILENSPAVYTPNRHGSVLINMANNYIYLKQFKRSIELIYLSKEFFKNVSFALSITDEILFYSYFYSGEFDKCMVLINNQRSTDSSEFLSSKFVFFKASVYFIQKDFINAISCLESIVEIKRDKEGWNVNHRILILLCRIELKEFESVDLQLQNLEKFIKRVSKNRVIKPRFILILKILIKLVNENFQYDKVFKSRKPYFDLLTSNEINYKWNLKSPELIDFSDWFKSKMI